MDRSALLEIEKTHHARLRALLPDLHATSGATDDLWSSATNSELVAFADTWLAARREIPRTRFSMRQAAVSTVEDRTLETTKATLSLWQEFGLASRDPDVTTCIMGALWREAMGTAGASSDGADDDKRDLLAKRIAALGTALTRRREQTKNAHPLLLDDARARAKMSAALLRDVLASARSGEDGSTRLRDAVATARPSLAEHERWLETVAVDADVKPLGKEKFDALLVARGLDLTSDDVLEMARTFIEMGRIEERRIRRRSFKSKSLDDASVHARTQAPYTLEEAVVWAQELVDQSKQFVVESHGFPLWSHDALVVEEGSGAIAAHFGAAIHVPVDGMNGSRIILSDADDELGLARFNVADLEVAIARLAYPGQHLAHRLSLDDQAAMTANFSPFGLLPDVRVVGAERERGWGLHVEELMREVGFRDSPAVRLVTAQSLKFSALLAWTDVSLGCGTITVDDAQALLHHHGGVPVSVARRCVIQMIRSPSLALSALVGKVRLGQLRRAAHTQWRTSYSDRRFHEMVLLAGNATVSSLFSLLDAFAPFNLDDGTAEYDLGESPESQR